MKTLTVADIRAFRSLCELQAAMDECSSKKDGRELITLRQNQDDEDAPFVVVVDSLLKAERDAATALRPYYELFGLTPVSRAQDFDTEGEG